MITILLLLLLLLLFNKNIRNNTTVCKLLVHDKKTQYHQNVESKDYY